MTTAQSVDVIQQIIKQLKLSPAFEKIPNEVLDKITPIIIVGQPRPPKDVIVRSIESGSLISTIYTTPTDKDFYLTTASISIISDLANVKAGGIDVTANGANIKRILGCISPQDGLTSESNSLSFVPPLKIDKGTTIQMDIGHSANEGVGTITGYLEEIEEW